MHRPNLRRPRSDATTLGAVLPRLDAAARAEAVRLFRALDRDGIAALAASLGVHRTGLWSAAVFLSHRQDRHGIAPSVPIPSTADILDRICGTAR